MGKKFSDLTRDDVAQLLSLFKLYMTESPYIMKDVVIDKMMDVLEEPTTPTRVDGGE